MAQCIKCSAELEIGSNFCSKCGAKQDIPAIIPSNKLLKFINKNPKKTIIILLTSIGLALLLIYIIIPAIEDYTEKKEAERLAELDRLLKNTDPAAWIMKQKDYPDLIDISISEDLVTIEYAPSIFKMDVEFSIQGDIARFLAFYYYCGVKLQPRALKILGYADKIDSYGGRNQITLIEAYYSSETMEKIDPSGIRNVSRGRIKYLADSWKFRTY